MPEPSLPEYPPVTANPTRCLYLPDEAATDHLGQVLAGVLRAGDVVFLKGDLGAGKTALARAVISSRLVRANKRAEDIPSPTFTLVQNYEADVPIWHADLYRLGDPDEVGELGLDDAFDQAITLIEWPDRLGDFAPARRLELLLTLCAPDGRNLSWAAYGAGWAKLDQVLSEFGAQDG